MKDTARSPSSEGMTKGWWALVWPDVIEGPRK
jgi:hypothetical protein